MKKVILMLAVAAMASCAKSELAERPATGDGLVELKFNSAAIETRTPFIGTIGDTETLTAQVLVSTKTNTYFETSGDGFYANGTVTFTDQSTAKGFNNQSVYYPVDDSQLFLVGLYPVNSWTFATENTGASVSHDIDGKTDLMFATEKNTKKSDVVVAAPAQPNYPTLQFKHLLTKYDIVAKAGDDKANENWGKITSIQLVNVKDSSTQPETKCTITFANSAKPVEFSGAGAVDFYMAKGSTTQPTVPAYLDTMIGENNDPENYVELADDDTTINAYAIAAPIDPSTNDFITLHVKTTKHTEGQDVKVYLKKDGSPVTGPTNGKTFTITLTFNSTELKVIGEVTDWTDGGTGTTEIQ